MWTVTRQLQWPDGGRVVEISQGGVDYCNPDALSPQYLGEMQEYEDPREAVESAIRIAQAWFHTDDPGREILIDCGATGGMTIPFVGRPLTEETFQELRKWAKMIYWRLPKCSQCSDILGEDRYMNRDLLWGEELCSERCLKAAVEAVLDEESEDEKDSGGPVGI